ncbi:hypothetical protein HanRHA438_Chr17g0834881 [Helianthus annuus]|nr:hypothetical protein HanRHA438_Chr17g0834881 [Helianthus annuus]
MGPTIYQPTIHLHFFLPYSLISNTYHHSPSDPCTIHHDSPTDRSNTATTRQPHVNLVLRRRHQSNTPPPYHLHPCPAPPTPDHLLYPRPLF